MARPILAFPVLLLVGVNFAPVLAQNQPKLSTPSQQPAATQPHDAKPADVASPDAILAAAYDVISGAAGQERDWDRMRSLFYPGAQLIRTAVKKEGGLSATFLTPEDYIVRAGSYFKKNSFFEREIARGINSFQLFFDGTRWWIITIYWSEETTQTPLPPEFLAPSR